MPYQLYKPHGATGLNPITVPDNAIDVLYYDSTNKIGIQYVGQNAVGYGTAVAQNTLQMVSNFAGDVVPNPSIALQGQLWFDVTSATTGSLYVRLTSSTASQPNQAADIATNWQKVITQDSSGNSNVPGNSHVGGGLTVDGSITAEGGSHVPVVNPITPADGDVQVLAGPVIKLYAGGVWNQVFPAVYS